MLLWNKIADLLVTNKLSLGSGAVLEATTFKGEKTPVGLGATETRAAATTLTAADNGKTIFLNSSTEFATTLPPPRAGLEFTFIVSAAPSGASYTVITSGSSNIIKGMVTSADLNAASDGDIETSGGDTISFVDAKAVAGDKVELKCDGTNWFAYGICTVFDAITITTAS